MEQKTAIKPPVEVRYREELEALAALDTGRRPVNWKLSPKAVRTFILGSREPLHYQGHEITIRKKYLGNDALVERCIITLAGNRGLMLVGEPGTAKTMLSELLVKGFLMGLSEEQAEMSVHLAEVLAADGDFFSLTKGFSHMLMLLELQDLYQVRDALHLDQVTEQCFQKIIQLLPSMGQVGEERQQECMESLRLLYQAAGRNNADERKPVLMDALKGLLGRGSVNPGVEGTVLGLLYGYEGGFGRQITETARGYIQGSGEMLSKSAAFLRGLFFTARDFVFVSGEFLNLIDELLGRLSGEEFLRLLPELRMAFGYFTPLETDRIAGRAAALHGRKKRDLLTGRRVSPEEFAYGETLDAYAGERIRGLNLKED